MLHTSKLSIFLFVNSLILLKNLGKIIHMTMVINTKHPARKYVLQQLCFGQPFICKLKQNDTLSWGYNNHNPKGSLSFRLKIKQESLKVSENLYHGHRFLLFKRYISLSSELYRVSFRRVRPDNVKGTMRISNVYVYFPL